MLTLVLALTVASSDCVSEQFPIIPRDKAIVDDAKRRWAETLYNKAEVDTRYPIVMEGFDERCVYLVPKMEFVGPTPVVCYKLGSDEFTRADFLVR